MASCATPAALAASEWPLNGLLCNPPSLVLLHSLHLRLRLLFLQLLLLLLHHLLTLLPLLAPLPLLLLLLLLPQSLCVRQKHGNTIIMLQSAILEICSRMLPISREPHTRVVAKTCLAASRLRAQ